MFKWFLKGLHSEKGDASVLVGIIFLAVVIAIVASGLLPAVISGTNNAASSSCLANLEAQGYWVLAGGSHYVPGDLLPGADNTYSLGSSIQRWKDIYFAGTMNTGALNATTIKSSSLTSGRPVISTTGGQLTDDAQLTYDSGLDTLTVPHITGLSDPSNAADAATKNYVDTHSGSSGGIGNFTGGGKTFVVATYDATTKEKSRADDVLTGTDDYIKLQADINAMHDGESLKIVGKNVYLGATGFYVYHKNFKFDSDPIIWYKSTSGIGATFGNGGSTNNYNYIRVNVKATEPERWTCLGTGVKLNGISNSYLDIAVDQFSGLTGSGGTCLEIATNTTNLAQFEKNWGKLDLYHSKTAIKTTGDYSYGNNWFSQINFDTLGGTTNEAFFDPSAGTWDVINWKVDQINIWPEYNLATNISLFKGSKFLDCEVGTLMIDNGSNASHPGYITVFDGVTSPTFKVNHVYWYAVNTSNLILRSGSSYPFIGDYHVNGEVQSNPALAYPYGAQNLQIFNSAGLINMNWLGTNEFKTGTGGTEVGLIATISTGSTSNSTAGRVSYKGFWHDKTRTVYNIATYFRYTQNSVSDLQDIWIGWFGTSNTFPTTISKHYAFRIKSTSNGINSGIYCSQGDGATETISASIDTLSQYQTVDLVMLYKNAAIEYYYSFDFGNTWYLFATQVTNVPDAGFLYPGAWAVNSEALSKEGGIEGMKFVLDYKFAP